MSSVSHPDQSRDAAFRVVRVVHVAMLGSAVLYVLVGELAAADLTRRSPDPMLGNILLVLGLGLAFAAILVRQKLTASARETLLHSPGNPSALGRWRVAHIVAFALAESVVLFGLVLRILGAPLATAAILYAIGIVALILISPRRP